MVLNDVLMTLSLLLLLLLLSLLRLVNNFCIRERLLWNIMLFIILQNILEKMVRAHVRTY